MAKCSFLREYMVFVDYVRLYMKEDDMTDLEQGRTEGELKTLAKNVEAAMKNFHISLKEACEGLGTTVEEYEKAKNLYHERGHQP